MSGSEYDKVQENCHERLSDKESLQGSGVEPHHERRLLEVLGDRLHAVPAQHTHCHEWPCEEVLPRLFTRGLTQ